MASVKPDIISTVEKMLANIKRASAVTRNPQAIAISYGTLIDMRDKVTDRIRPLLDQVCDELLIQVERAAKNSQNPSHIAIASAILIGKFNKKVATDILPLKKIDLEERRRLYQELREARAKKGSVVATKESEEDFEA